MEERLITSERENLLDIISSELQLQNMNPMEYSSLALAYIGDDAYDLVIRTYLLSKGNMQVNKINQKANELVKASTQSAMMGIIEPLLDEKELGVYKRGRNAKSYTKAKNATVADYRRATGFEALMGYLYLLGNHRRMLFLIHKGMEGMDKCDLKN